MPTRLTVLFFGDSFVAGVGDPTGLGWTGRLAAGPRPPGLDLTVYPLGVRRDTSADVLARWEPETSARLPDTGATGLVLALGVNDATDDDLGGSRVAAADTVGNLRAVLTRASSLGLATLVVGPPPIADPRTNDRIVELDALLADEARAHQVPVVPVVHDLLADEAWMSEVRAGDGAHPGAHGYAALAALVRPRWETWLDGGISATGLLLGRPRTRQ
ncbi:GDSL-type esterase/lipase family protein [Cellulomonas sp. Leaf334]|uniref:GDSL-type esterase/lipase family protein n=1 Tax=Cellulomonas sp. Leaf334 TaxID=1736339 RepID=UPI0006FE0988|nr:GDSL-type esterase/lipase family protein [Cellulomonas sp. Leaf334]KQR11878.1 hypothetical protein ASF78_11775 [Cellulomonas sp. Leaf334]